MQAVALFTKKNQKGGWGLPIRRLAIYLAYVEEREKSFAYRR
jgi:hypothetical protein